MVAACTRGRLLSDARAGDGGGLDAGDWALRRHRWLVLVAELSRQNLSFTQIFTTVAVPGLISAVALLVKQFAHPEDKSAYAVAKGEALSH